MAVGFLEDLVGGFGSDEWVGAVVPAVDVGAHRGGEVADTIENAPVDGLEGSGGYRCHATFGRVQGVVRPPHDGCPRAEGDLTHNAESSLSRWLRMVQEDVDDIGETPP